jgi:hypothetical protein
VTIREAAEKLHAEIIQNDFDDTALNGAYTSDLLSDVMAHAKDGGALITIQAHKNTIAVATLVNISVVIVCNNRPIPDDMIESARDEGVAILRTRENQYTVSGKLYTMIGESQE